MAAKTKAAKARGVPGVTIVSPSGGPPLPCRAAPLARRFQQVCASMVAESLAGEDPVQLEFGTLIALEIEPEVDQRRLADAMGIILVMRVLLLIGFIRKALSSANQ